MCSTEANICFSQRHCKLSPVPTGQGLTLMRFPPLKKGYENRTRRIRGRSLTVSEGF